MSFTRAVKSDRKLKQALEAVVHVRLDQSDPADARQLRRLNVDGFPTFVLQTARGEEIERWSGFAKSKPFIARLAAALADPRLLEQKIATFDPAAVAPQDRAAAALRAKSLAESLQAANRPLDAVTFYDHAARLDPRLEPAVAWGRTICVREAVLEGRAPLSDLEAAVAKVPRTSKWTALSIARVMVEAWPENRDRAGLRPYVEPALPLLRGSRSWKVQQRRELEAALRPVPTIAELQAAYEQAPNAETEEALALALSDAQRYPEVLALLRRPVERDARQESHASGTGLKALALGLERGDDLAAADVRPAVAHYLKGHKEPLAPVVTAYWAGRALGRGQDDAFLAEQIEAGLARAEKVGDDARRYREALLVRKALSLEKDREKARRLTLEYLGEGWDENPSSLAEYAQFLRRNGYGLEEAERHAGHAVELAADRYERASANDALADVLYAQGRVAEACAALARAADAVPRWVHLRRKLERWDAEAKAAAAEAHTAAHGTLPGAGGPTGDERSREARRDVR